MIDFMLFGGLLTDRQTDRRMDIGGCRLQSGISKNSPTFRFHVFYFIETNKMSTSVHISTQIACCYCSLVYNSLIDAPTPAVCLQHIMNYCPLCIKKTKATNQQMINSNPSLLLPHNSILVTKGTLKQMMISSINHQYVCLFICHLITKIKESNRLILQNHPFSVLA